MRPLLATLLGLGLLTAGLSEARQRKTRDEGRSRIADEGVAFRLLPGGGGQSTVPGDFCGLFSQHLVGNHFCLNGDGTSTSGMVDGGTAMALEAVGTPTTYTAPLCPSGANCSPANSQRLSSGNNYTTAEADAPSEDLSACVGFQLDSVGGTQRLIARDNGGLSRTFTVVLSGGNIVVGVYKSGGASTLVTGGTPTARARHLYCFTYDFVADGTSVLRAYLDGAAVGTPSTTAVGPLNNPALPYTVGALSDGTQFVTGLYSTAFVTETVLSPAVIQDMSRAATGLLSGSFGEAVTFSRTSAASCYDESGQYLTQLPAGRPCVSRMSLSGRPAWTNYLLRNDDYDTSWSKFGVTVDVDQLVAPDGSKTADRIRKSDNTGSRNVNQSFTASTSGERWSCAAWLSGDVYDSAAFGIYNTTAAAWSPQTGSVLAGPGELAGGSSFQTITGLATDGGWTRVCSQVNAATDGGARALYVYPVGVGTGNADAGTFLAQSICSPTAYCPDDCGPTAGTSLACAAESATVPTAGWPTAAGSVCLRYTPQFSSTPAAGIYLVDARSASDGWLLWGQTERLRFQTKKSGSSDTNVVGDALAWTPGATYTICAEWGGGNVRLTRDGADVGKLGDGTATMPTAVGTSAGIGNSAAGTGQITGRISDLVVRHR
jgi:hypothetical protein